MRLNVQSPHFKTDFKLDDFIQKKLNKLDQFFDRIISGEVYLRVENDNHTENKLVEIKLNLPHKELFVKNQAKTFEEATDICVEILKKQIKKIKDRALEHVG